jgi:hypothetical protein
MSSKQLKQQQRNKKRKLEAGEEDVEDKVVLLIICVLHLAGTYLSITNLSIFS